MLEEKKASIDDILASIRRIMRDDPVTPAKRPARSSNDLPTLAEGLEIDPPSRPDLLSPAEEAVPTPSEATPFRLKDALDKKKEGKVPQSSCLPPVEQREETLESLTSAHAIGQEGFQALLERAIDRRLEHFLKQKGGGGLEGLIDQAITKRLNAILRSYAKDDR